MQRLRNQRIPQKKGIAVVRNGHAWIADKRFPLEGYKFQRTVDQGSNAVVFKAESTLLRRVEAVKVYIPRPGDPRNKIKQGAFESQKQAAASFLFSDFHIIKIYHAAILGGHLYTTLEFFDGPNLKEWNKLATLKDKWIIAHLYNDAMHFTSKPDLFHGDPHMGNILVGKRHIAICDYGTSHFSGRAKGWDRHWKIVDEVMTTLLSGFESFKYYRETWPYKSPEMIWAAYRDVLRALTTELIQKTDGTAEEFTQGEKLRWQLF